MKRILLVFILAFGLCALNPAFGNDKVAATGPTGSLLAQFE